MKTLLHELHPTLIHAPLALLPAAVATDFVAAASGDKGWDRAGKALWIAGTAGGLAAGLAGMAASREVRPPNREAEDAMLLHGAGNTVIVLAALGMTAYRLCCRASIPSASAGLAAVGAAVYTGWLGGKLVYSHGLGIERAQGVGDSPPLASKQALGRFFRDALAGAMWIVARSGRIARGREEFRREAFAAGRPEPRMKPVEDEGHVPPLPLH